MKWYWLNSPLRALMSVVNEELSVFSITCLISTDVIFALQKAIKEKDIPIDGVEFMGPNKEKPGS